MKTYATRAAVLALILAAPAAFAQTPDDSAAISSVLTWAIPLGMFTFFGLAGVGLAIWGKKLDADTTGSKQVSVLKRLHALGDIVVHEMEFVIKAEWELASADGVVTKAEMQRMKAAAVNRLVELATKEGLEEAKTILKIAAGGMGTLLGGIIEAALDRMKATKALAKPVTVVAAPQALATGSGEVIKELVNKTTVVTSVP